MTRDPLATALLLRRRAVDDARRVLAAALADATAAHDAACTAERAIESEARIAADPAGDDALVEAFAAWLPAARHRAAQARALHDRMEAAAACRRAELQACNTAMEAVSTMIAARAASLAGNQARRDQHELDESAARQTPRLD